MNFNFRMRRKFVIGLLIFVCVLLFSSCTELTEGIGTDNTANQEEAVIDVEYDIQELTDNVLSVVNVALFNDASSVGLVKMLEERSNVADSEYIFDFEIEENTDKLSSQLISGEIDIAAVPALVAVKLFNETNGGIAILGIHSYGIQRDVEANGHDDNDNEIEAETDFHYVSGVIVVSKEFADNNTDAIKAFLANCKLSAEYANVNRNDAAALMNKHGFSEPSEYIFSDISIGLIDGEEMKNMFSEYIGNVAAEDLTEFGGKAPNDDFYYIVK